MMETVQSLMMGVVPSGHHLLKLTKTVYLKSAFLWLDYTSRKLIFIKTMIGGELGGGVELLLGLPPTRCATMGKFIAFSDPWSLQHLCMPSCLAGDRLQSTPSLWNSKAT